MQHYRAYFIGLDGHFIKSIDMSCSDDGAARDSARKLVEGYYDVELWQGARPDRRRSGPHLSRDFVDTSML